MPVSILNKARHMADLFNVNKMLGGGPECLLFPLRMRGARRARKPCPARPPRVPTPARVRPEL